MLRLRLRLNEVSVEALAEQLTDAVAELTSSPAWVRMLGCDGRSDRCGTALHGHRLALSTTAEN